MRFIRTKSFKIATYARGDSDSSKLALVLPGKLDTKDYPHMRSHVEHLASRDYFALSFDPPGTWESPGSIELYTMSNYLKAINELIEHFEDKPTFVVGHSRGGSMAMLAGIENPHVTHFASIMSYYSFTPDVHGGHPDKKWKKKGYKIERRDIPGEGSNESKEFRLHYGFLEDQIQYDMLEGLKKSKKPKLFILGKKDTTVEPEIVKEAYNASSPTKLLYELDSKHDYRHDRNLINEVNSVIDDFLEKFKD